MDRDDGAEEISVVTEEGLAWLVVIPSPHFTAGPVVASGVVVVAGGGGGGHSRVGGAAAAAAGSAVNPVAAVGVVGDDSCSVSPL